MIADSHRVTVLFFCKVYPPTRALPALADAHVTACGWPFECSNFGRILSPEAPAPGPKVCQVEPGSGEFDLDIVHNGGVPGMESMAWLECLDGG